VRCSAPNGGGQATTIEGCCRPDAAERGRVEILGAPPRGRGARAVGANDEDGRRASRTIYVSELIADGASLYRTIDARRRSKLDGHRRHPHS